MSIAGQIFQMLAILISSQFGYGSHMAIDRTVLYESLGLDWNSGEVVSAYYFLVDDGWISENSRMYLGTQKGPYGTPRKTWKFTDTKLSLTDKGWAVAQKYIDLF